MCPFTGREMRAKSAKRVEVERHFSASCLKTDEETLTKVRLLLCCANARAAEYYSLPQGCRTLCSRDRRAHCECTYRYIYISSACTHLCLHLCCIDRAERTLKSLLLATFDQRKDVVFIHICTFNVSNFNNYVM